MSALPASADRNLLFGVLALQADLVSRDQLVAGMNAWVVEKATPLAEILVRQGALSPEDRALLEPLVARHLARHGGDPQKSLAAVSSVNPSARAALAFVPDSDVQASVLKLPGPAAPQGPAAADPAATRGVSVLTREAGGLRYTVLRPHARGGLGEVFVARDEEVHRDVALKEIQAQAAFDAESRARFLLEAEVTAGLEHPGVVPVYGLGAYEDGRPFYAMRFVKGDNLKDAISRFHSEECRRRSASERNLAFRDLLGRFVDVCETLAYAHARGVLHRDLKPGNVMLGRYGETLVVDWGLAKIVGRPEISAPRSGTAFQTTAPRTADEANADETLLRPSSAGGGTATRTGRAVGTPAYMSPEQAAGRLHELGPASDVYSLGATLYTLLTGRPPVEGDDVGEVLRKVRNGEVVPPRRLEPSAPKALEAVCLKAMALRPEDRYASAKDLAEEIEHFLADEPVFALPETLLEKTGRWTRRHRTETATAAAAVLILFVAGGAFGWWYQSLKAERAAEAAVLAAEARARAETARREIGEAIARAAELREQARWGAARTLLDAAERRLSEAAAEDLAGCLRIARSDLDAAAALDDVRLRKTAGLVTLRGRPDYGFANGRDGAYAAAFEAYFAARGRPAADLWNGDPAAVGRVIAESEIASHLTAALDDWAVDETDPAVASRLLELARLADPDPLRVRLRDPAVRSDPAALAAVSMEASAALPPASARALAKLLRNAGKREESADVLARALARHPDDFWLHFSRAFVSESLGRRADALAHTQAALVARPDVVAARHNLVVNLAGLGRTEEAVTACRQAIESTPEAALLHIDLGGLMRRLGRSEEAEAAYRRAIEIDPRSGPAQGYLAFLLAETGRADEAEECYRRAIEFDPEDGAAYDGLAGLLAGLGRTDDALAAFQKAIEFGPADTDRYLRRADLFVKLTQWADAATDYVKAAELQPEQGWWPYLASRAYLAAGDGERCRTVVQGMLARLTGDADPDVAERALCACVVLADLSSDPSGLDALCEAAGKSAGGAVRLVAAARYRQGRFAEAVRLFEESASGTPLRAWDHLFLAMAYHRLGEPAEARAHLTAAERWATLASESPGGDVTWAGWWESQEVAALRREATTLFEAGVAPVPPAEAPRPSGSRAVL